MTDIAIRSGTGRLAAYTPPTPDQIVELLQLCAAYDKRTFGLSEKAAWSSASAIGHWTHGEAVAAIHHHKATRTEYLEPAHITRWIELNRRKRRLQGGTADDGTRFPSHAEAVDLWVTRMREAGANPTREQTAHVDEVLAELLDGASTAALIVQAIVQAARKLTSRIEWALESIGKDAEKGGKPRMPEGVPLEFIPDRLLNVRFAVGWSDFPAEWVRYDPFGEEAERLADLAKSVPGTVVNAPTPRDVPDWVAEHLADASLHFASPERQRVQAWFDEDRHAWKTEQIKVVRRWYAAHPDLSPNLPDRPAFEGY